MVAPSMYDSSQSFGSPLTNTNESSRLVTSPLSAVWWVKVARRVSNANQYVAEGNVDRVMYGLKGSTCPV